MSSASKPKDLPELEAPPPSIQWRSWPLADSPVAAAAVLAVLAATGAAVWSVTGRAHLAGLAVGVLVIAYRRFFIPTRFEMSADGISLWHFGRRRHVPWREVRRCQVCSSGVAVLGRADACPLDACRGLYVPWGPYRREVLAHIRYHVDRTAGP